MTRNESFEDMVVRKWHPVLLAGNVPHSEQVEVARTLEGIARAINASAGMSDAARAVILDSAGKMLALQGEPT